MRERAQPCVLGRLLPVLFPLHVAIRGLGARRVTAPLPETPSASHALLTGLSLLQRVDARTILLDNISVTFAKLQLTMSFAVTQSPLYKGLHNKFCFVFSSRRNSLSADKLACFLLSENENYGTLGAPLSAPRLDKTELDLLPACCNLLNCGVQRHLFLLLPLNGLILCSNVSLHFYKMRESQSHLGKR